MSSDTLERQANRLELVTRWADDLAHEIKNPLHAMVINLELVKRRAGGGDPESIVERAEVVESELHRVHELVDSLLRLIRPWPPTGTATVHHVFDALLPVFRARARIRRIEYEHEQGEGMATIPPGDLAQVLVNLVDIAIDAAPEGGRIATTVTLDEREVRITVRDHERVGDPPPPDPLPAKPAGRPSRAGDGAETRRDVVGAGDRALVVTRRLVNAAGGSLRLERTEDGGTAVVTVPRAGAA